MDPDVARVIANFVDVLDQFSRTQRDLIEGLQALRGQLPSLSGHPKDLLRSHGLPPPPGAARLPSPPSSMPPYAGPTGLPAPPPGAHRPSLSQTDWGTGGSLPPPPQGGSVGSLPLPPAHSRRGVAPPPPSRTAPPPPPSAPSPSPTAPRSQTGAASPPRTIPDPSTGAPRQVAPSPIPVPADMPAVIDVPTVEEARPLPGTVPEAAQPQPSSTLIEPPSRVGSAPSGPAPATASTKRDYDYFIELDERLAGLRGGSGSVERNDPNGSADEPPTPS